MTKTGWTIAHKGESVFLNYNQYGRYLAWQRSTFSIEQMLPELNDREREILKMAAQQPPVSNT